MKVLDESGVKKIVKDYKTADKTINSNINIINNILNGVSSELQAMFNRYNYFGFAIHGVSNEESGLIIPIDDGQPISYIIEGIHSLFYCKVNVDSNFAFVRTKYSEQTAETLIETIEDDDKNRFLIVAQADVTEPVVIKPIIDKLSETYYFNYSQYDIIEKANGSLSDIEDYIGFSSKNKFKVFIESDI